jgi:hypothetical protein
MITRVRQGTAPTRTRPWNQTLFPISATSPQIRFGRIASDGVLPDVEYIRARGLVWPAHAERSVSLLPRKIEAVLTQPPRGVRFQNLNGLRNRHVGWKANQQMRMGGNPTRGQDGTSGIPADPRKVFPELWQHVLRNEISPFLGAEDAMDEKVGHALTYSRFTDICLCRMSRRRRCLP